ncbi:hypothetical protein BDZ97DRAFT_1762163 [Flammula alnicola]|nr:hypothetical protein BDZ97DRAFT_1762163 [Flammula alnicola]
MQINTTIYNPDGPFLPDTKIGCLEFLWNTIKGASRNSDDLTIKDAFRCAMPEQNTKKKLITFITHGRAALISSIVIKACDHVQGFYGLNSPSDKVQKHIIWLLTESHFMYGGINLEKHTLDSRQPFGSDLIIEIIESQWFSISSRSNVDAETTTKIAEKKDLPLSIIIFVITTIEHALKGWSSAFFTCTTAKKQTISSGTFNF